MTKKCLGCGDLISNELNLCERCFRLKNYGELKKVSIEENVFKKFLDEIKKTNDLVIMVADILSLPENFNIINELNNPVLLVLTKKDLLPVTMNESKLLNKIKGDFVDKVIISNKNNYNYDLLMSKIKKYQTSKKVYVIGNTNAGKSSMINKLIYNYSFKESSILTSYLPSTTLDTIEIALNDNLMLIDTPGFINENAIDIFLNKEQLLKTNPRKMIKPLIYQVKIDQTFNIENILKIKVKGQTDIVFYISNSLKIERIYKELKEKSVKTINISSNNDLVIPGLGFIKFKKSAIAEIYADNDILIYTRDSLI